MGSGRFDYASYSTATLNTRNLRGEALHATEIFKETRVNQALDGATIEIRESRDSEDNPESTPIIFALDVTGSMGFIAADMLATQMGKIMNSILQDKIVSDPHIAFMALGDVNFDRSPNQMTQFEADDRIVKQLLLIFNEQGGGGNDSESYDLAWYMAAKHTITDSFEKRKKKGYLFTIGDEMFPYGITARQASLFTSDKTHQGDYDALDLYNEASKMYDCFHIIIIEGNYCRGRSGKVIDYWKSKIGNSAIPLFDYKLLDSLVKVIMIVNETNKDPNDVIQSLNISNSDKKTLNKSFDIE